MTLDYSTNRHISDVTSVLNEYSGWFTQVLRCLSYPGEAPGRPAALPPDSYAVWIENMKQAGMALEALSKLNGIQEEVVKESDRLVQAALAAGASPLYGDYDHLLTVYEEFIRHIRRVEQDVLLEGHGMDALTGLRSEAVLKKDITREMERLARQGKQFCLALIRIDNFEQIKQQTNQDIIQESLKRVAEMIRRSLRSFDDAYRLESDEFLLMLKQARMDGGIRAMERLKRELEQDSLTYQLRSEVVPLSLSSCIAEPVAGDDINELLANLHADLDACSKEDGAVFEYFEMSPLERFVKGSGN